MKLLNALNVCEKLNDLPILLIMKMLKIYNVPVFFMNLKAQSASVVNQLVYFNLIYIQSEFW